MRKSCCYSWKIKNFRENTEKKPWTNVKYLYKNETKREKELKLLPLQIWKSNKLMGAIEKSQFHYNIVLSISLYYLLKIRYNIGWNEKYLVYSVKVSYRNTHLAACIRDFLEIFLILPLTGILQVHLHFYFYLIRLITLEIR